MAHNPSMGSSAARAHHDVCALAQADLALDELAAELSAVLSGVIPHEGYCLIGFDPISGLRTFHTGRNALVGDPTRMVHNETVEHDLHRFTDLARRGSPIGTLGGGGPGEARSPRLHEVLAGQGFSRELRLALRSGTTLSAYARAGRYRRHCPPAWQSSARTTLPRPSAPRRQSGSAIFRWTPMSRCHTAYCRRRRPPATNMAYSPTISPGSAPGQGVGSA